MECLCLFDDPSMNRMSVAICSILAAKVSSSCVITGFSQALEIMENLENHQKKFHAWKNHGI